MCTLILGRDVIAPGTALLAANRDEDPHRPSDPPGVLSTRPRVVGGRDRLAGGTWLAVRGREAAVALLNRRDASGEPAARDGERRSRGLLALDVATVAPDFAVSPGGSAERRELLRRLASLSGPGLPYAALCRTFASLWDASYAPFTLVFAAPESCWLVALETGQPPRVEAIRGGWHAITHRDLDDPGDPRTARVLDELAHYRTRSVDQAVQRLRDLLRSHGGPGSRLHEEGAPPVCLHEGRMITVSSSIVWLAHGEARYLHAEGRPCERPFEDRTALLTATRPTEER